MISLRVLISRASTLIKERKWIRPLFYHEILVEVTGGVNSQRNIIFASLRARRLNQREVDNCMDALERCCVGNVSHHVVNFYPLDMTTQDFKHLRKVMIANPRLLNTPDESECCEWYLQYLESVWTMVTKKIGERIGEVINGLPIDYTNKELAELFDNTMEDRINKV
jgi:hypothetical protein